MPRHLRLSPLQETDLLAYFEQRLKDLDRDNKERIEADKQSDLDYQNSKDARAKPGTVFNESNMSVPLTSWVVDHFSSRTEEELFSRDPMATFAPEGTADDDTARGVDRWCNYKMFKLGDVQDDLLEAQHSAWTHRALILKAIYFEDADEWEEWDVPILHDRANMDQPVEILDHGNIIEGQDSFVPVEDPLTPGAPSEVLEADPTFRKDPQNHYFKPSAHPIRFKHVHYSGPKTLEVDSDCFRAPSDAKSLDECDFIAEYYDKPIHWIASRFVDRDGLTFDQFKTRLGQQNAKKKTKGKRQETSKENLSYDLTNSMHPIVEIWLTRDVLGWGKPQRIVCWMERETKTLIDYEFQKKVTPHGRHPYTAIAPWKPHGAKYWWGKSLVEMMKPFQDYVDLQWNRHSFRNSINANPIVMQNPDAIQEKKTFFELKPFETVTAESSTTDIKEWLQVFSFPKEDLDTKELISQAIEWCNFWLGISNLSQGDYSDVPQNTTLGGQEATLREASKLSRRWTRRLKNGVEDHLEKSVQIAIATMEPEEAYSFLEGDKQQTAFIQQDAVQGLKMDVKLQVGRDRSSQAIQEQQLTTQIVERYFTYPPPLQLAMRRVCKLQLYLLGHDNVDTLLPKPLTVIDPMTGVEVAIAPAGGVPMAAPAGAPGEGGGNPEQEPASSPPAEEPAAPPAPAAP